MGDRYQEWRDAGPKWRQEAGAHAGFEAGRDEERKRIAAMVRALVCDCEWGHADDCPQRVNAIADMIEKG